MYQKLMTKEIIKKLPPLGSQDGKPPDQVPIVVKFFTPWGSWSWFATEGEYETGADGGDWTFFGMVHGFEKELGYFSLNELKGLKGPMGLHIERDMHFEGHTLAEVQ